MSSLNGIFRLRMLIKGLREQRKYMIESGLYTEEEYKEYSQKCVSDLEWQIIKRDRERSEDFRRWKEGY